MNKRRKALEQEVEEHVARIAMILASLKDIEGGTSKAANSPHHIREAEAMRLELHGRHAAVAVGVARLSLDLP